MKPRKTAARLGTVAHIGVHPVRAWVKNGRLHFHRLHDRMDDPEPICLKDLYRKHSGAVAEQEIFETDGKL